MVPNILQPVLVQATIAIAGAILAESTLSLLGLGVLALLSPRAYHRHFERAGRVFLPHSLLRMCRPAQRDLCAIARFVRNEISLSAAPALAVVIAVLSFNLLRDAWRDWLDPRARSQLGIAHLSRWLDSTQSADRRSWT